MKRIFIFIFLAILLIFISSGLAFGQGRELEIEYPEIGGYEITQTTTSIPEYVRYIYFAIIGLSGLIALAVLVWAGFNYLTSTGIPEKIKTAREQIAAAILGLIILFCSWLIVNTINPELTFLRVTPPEEFIPELASGVYLCKEQVGIVDAWYKIRAFETADSERRKEIKKELESIFSDISKHCSQEVTSQEVTSYGTYVPEFFKEVKYVYLVPLIEGAKYEEYGAILYEKPNREGKVKIVYEQFAGRAAAPTEAAIKPEISKLSSIITFRLIPPDQSKGVRLYEHPNYNKDVTGEIICYPSASTGESCETGSWGGWIVGPFTPLSFIPQSIELYGEVIAILSKGEKYAVFTSSNPNLLDNEAITERKCTGYLWWRDCIKIPVADTLQLISASIYMW